MVITYYGGACIKVSFGDITVAANPISKTSKLKSARFGANIVLVSLHHPDFDGVSEVTYGDRLPAVFDGPGEYEIHKVFIKGVPTMSAYDDGHFINTVYTISLEGIRLCFLGALSSRKLPTETAAALGNIDILFVPIGGGSVLSARDAHEFAVSLEAKIIIPTLYDTKALNAFLKEEGNGTKKPLDKLTLKKKDLEGKEGEIVVLSLK